MPRVAEARDPAEPSSPGQQARVLRILTAAEDLVAETDIDRVQMHEVASRAGVAIATLYRYFPSKTHLFVGVMAHQIDRMAEAYAKRPKVAGGAADRVYDLLVRATRALIRRPHLARAIMTSSAAANAATVTDVARIDTTLRRLLFSVAGIEHPTAYDYAVVRLLLQVWSGILQSALNGRLSVADAESDLKLACRQLMKASSVGKRGLHTVD